MESPTLKDVAQALGVSVATVHRALNGKAGVSDAVRTEICSAAAQMGYRANSMASALKRKRVKLAVAFPEPTMDSRYYYLCLWQGARQFFRTVSEFPIEVIECGYPLRPGGNGAMLKDIYQRYGDGLDGLVTIADQDSQSSYFIEQLHAKGVPITLVGADLYREHRLCCVKSYDELAGSLAAELLCSFYPGQLDAPVVLTGNPGGSFSMVDQYYNVSGFQQHWQAYAPQSTVLTAYSADAQSSARQVRALLQEREDIYAIYSTSARHTVQMSQLLEQTGLQGRIKLVGNDRFPESVAYLTQGVLTAVIDKKVDMQSYRAAQALFQYVLKGAYPPSSTVQIEPAILLRGNAGIPPCDCG